MRDPARQPAEGEQHGEHPGRKAHRPIDHPGIEVDVRVELALNEVVVGQRDLFHGLGDVEQLVISTQLAEDLVGLLLDDSGARIVILVNPVAEAHQLDPVLAVFDLADECVHIATAGTDLLQHLQHRLVGATVQWAPQRVDPAGDRREQVGLGRAHQAHRRGRTVLLVIGVQDQQHVQRPDDLWVDVVGFGRQSEGHSQEVFDKRHRIVRVKEGLTDRLLVGVCGDGRQLGQQPDRRQLDLVVIHRIKGVLVVGAECVDRAGQHRHGVRVAREPVEEPLEILVQQSMPLDLGGELLEFLGRR